MKIKRMVSGLCLCAVAMPLVAVSGTVTDGPKRGLSQQDVRAQYGEPQVVKGPVGQPPITRWDYPHYVVYFEYQTVLHTVHTDNKNTTN